MNYECTSMVLYGYNLALWTIVLIVRPNIEVLAWLGRVQLLVEVIVMYRTIVMRSFQMMICLWKLPIGGARGVWPNAWAATSCGLLLWHQPSACLTPDKSSVSDRGVGFCEHAWTFVQIAVAMIWTANLWITRSTWSQDATATCTLFWPLRQKLLKTLQNEAIFPLITKNTLIYPSDFWPFCLLLFQLFKLSLSERQWKALIFWFWQWQRCRQLVIFLKSNNCE